MNWKRFFTFKKVAVDAGDRFSDFFLNEPLEAKKDVLAKAARKANEDQMRVFKKSQIPETA